MKAEEPPIANLENGRPVRSVRRADAEAIEARERTPLRLMPECAADLPLWGRSLEPLDLSPWLLDRLAQWQDDFDENFDPFNGWKTPEAREKWRREADRLASELRAALPDEIQLEVDLWPLEQLDN